MDLLNRIEALLKEKGMTKLEFAEKTGVNVFNWNEELGNPSYQKLVTFAGVFGKPILMLFVDEELMRHQIIYDWSFEEMTNCPYCGKPLDVKK